MLLRIWQRGKLEHHAHGINRQTNGKGDGLRIGAEGHGNAHGGTQQPQGQRLYGDLSPEPAQSQPRQAEQRKGVGRKPGFRQPIAPKGHRRPGQGDQQPQKNPEGSREELCPQQKDQAGQ